MSDSAVTENSVSWVVIKPAVFEFAHCWQSPRDSNLSPPKDFLLVSILGSAGLQCSEKTVLGDFYGNFLPNLLLQGSSHYHSSIAVTRGPTIS